MKLIARLALGLAGAVVVASAAPAAPAITVPKFVADAVANPARPDADRQRDGDRKPADVVAFSGIQPGWKVVDFIPGTGYFSRIFSSAVGPAGHVYAFLPV